MSDQWLRESSGEVPAALRASPVLLAVPSLLLGGGAAADAFLGGLHALMPVVVGILKGVAWGFYLRACAKAAGGVEDASPAVPIGCMVLTFVSLEYGITGAPVAFIIWLLPLYDYAVMYGEGLDAALGGVIDTIRKAPLVWPGAMLALIILLVMLGIVLSMPMSLFTDYANREGAWLAELTGGVLLGPLVHTALLFRARLLLAINGEP